MTGMLDLRNEPYIEIQISTNGKILWINTEKKCIVRIQNIGRVIINDRRR